MPTVAVDDTTLRYAVLGDDSADGEPVVFVPDAAFGPWLWSWQAPGLAGPRRSVVIATRGTDGSDATGPYDVATLAGDIEAVIADVGARRVHVVGAGLGGLAAIRYARRYGRARTLVLLGVPDSATTIDRDALAGLYPADPTRLRDSLGLAFSERFLAESDLVDRIVEWRRREDATGDARAGHLAALTSAETGPLVELTLPALVCHGTDDPIVPTTAGETLAEPLPRGRFEPVAGRRLCFVEHSVAVTDAIDSFLADHAGD